jgi:two-component system, NtrC family, sensor histidine kinase KinB
MFATLRGKLLLGLTPLLAIVLGLGLGAILILDHLGGRIDVILRENYASVLAAQGMKEALERMDSAAQMAISGEDERARKQFEHYRPYFEKNLEIERNNVTLPGEQELADRLARSYAEYLPLMEAFYRLPPKPSPARAAAYFDPDRGLLRWFDEIRLAADEVQRINQANMLEEDRKARQAARTSRRWMILGLLTAAAVATGIALGLGRSILEPIQGVTRSARAMARGDYDQVVAVTTRDELGELAAAFNTMARTLREYRLAGTARLVRAQRTAQATIDSFPDPVVVVDSAGAVERANPAARRVLGVAPAEEPVPWTPPPPLQDPLAEVLRGRPDYLPTGMEQTLCLRDDGQERFYLPRILAMSRDEGLPGAAVVLHDVTRLHRVDQLKSDMVSTVSHELKTPLTSVRMAIYLLLEEIVGPLTPKQLELLIAARQDADRLLAMINDLLDLTRIEQGRLKLDRRPAAPADLVRGAIERFEVRARDAGVELTSSVPPGLPCVLVDVDRVEHIFDNLLDNALAHTARGGSIHLAAESPVRDGAVRFRLGDTGEGIPPEHLPWIFERFYRVPGSRSRSGAGLGLAIVREIVAAHGGKIETASEVGKGTTFTFQLPIATGDGVPLT